MTNADEMRKLKKAIQATVDKKGIDAILGKEVRACDKALKLATPAKTGDVRRAWVTKRVGMLHYEITNDKKTQGGKYLLIDILDEGHGEILPIVAKSLFIPLSNRARLKPPRAKIPKDWVYGEDYILAKKAKAVEGKHFIEKILEDTELSLVRKLQAFLGGIK